MPCGVNSCSIKDDRFLWKCEFCNQKYHAACVGVQRQREHFITDYMVPMCRKCQEILRKEVDVRKMLHQQEQLLEAIQSQTDASHRINGDLKKFCLVAELFDSIEHLLTDVKETLTTINKNNQSMCSAVGQQMKSCDQQMHTALTGISESNSTMPQKISKHLDERLSSLTNDIISSIKEAESSIPLQKDDSKLLEILEEVKFVSGAVSSLQTNITNSAKTNDKTLQEELAENSSCPKTALVKDHTSPGWRFLGTKWHWKKDWSQFDAKQRSRRLQEKAADKAKRNRKRQKQLFNRTNNPSHQQTLQNQQHPQPTTSKQTSQTDKEMLASAKVQFAGPPSTTDHPIAGLSATKIINFKKGETINAKRNDRQAAQNKTTEPNPETTESNSTASSESNQSTPGWTLDPMRPPIVSMTQQSAAGDGRFLKARLRDPKIMYIVRLYLAYLHDKEPTFCHDGMTNTSVKINLASEGLPTSMEELRKIFYEVHQEYGVAEKAASDDLDSYRRHLNNQRIQHLQRVRESADKFHSPSSNFRK